MSQVPKASEQRHPFRTARVRGTNLRDDARARPRRRRGTGVPARCNWLLAQLPRHHSKGGVDPLPARRLRARRTCERELIAFLQNGRMSVRLDTCERHGRPRDRWNRHSREPVYVTETPERLKRAIGARGFGGFTHIDHRAAARAHGLELPPTTVVIFGDHHAGRWRCS